MQHLVGVEISLYECSLSEYYLVSMVVLDFAVIQVHVCVLHGLPVYCVGHVQSSIVHLRYPTKSSAPLSATHPAKHLLQLQGVAF